MGIVVWRGFIADPFLPTPLRGLGRAAHHPRPLFGEAPFIRGASDALPHKHTRTTQPTWAWGLGFFTQNGSMSPQGLGRAERGHYSMPEEAYRWQTVARDLLAGGSKRGMSCQGHAVVAQSYFRTSTGT